MTTGGLVIDENLTVACKSNSIQILELQRQGKNKQTAHEFLLGKKISKNSFYKYLLTNFSNNLIWSELSVNWYFKSKIY